MPAHDTSTGSGLRTIIIGAGFGGIAAALALRRAGFGQLLLLERGADVGGVWRDNHYPGACCDIPAALYSYSFTPGHAWSCAYPPQAEILAYLKSVLRQHDLARHIRCGQAVVDARWDAARACWSVRTAQGERHEAEQLVSAVGIFNDPQWPRLPGAERFDGPAFHSAAWRHEVALRGRRVAVIGTGASAVQIVPALVAQGAGVTLFQRSAPYVLPKPDPAPGAPSEQRARLFREFEALAARRADLAATAQAQAAFLRYLAQQVPDPALRARLTPDFTLGCKRSAFSNDWYATLQRPEVELVSEPIAAVEPQGLRGADGRLHAADCIVYATGFRPAAYLPGLTLQGRDGCTLAEAWGEAPRAYLGLCVPGFPNLYLMFGPNTNVAGSVIHMLECQAGFIAQAAATLRRHGARALEVRDEALERHDQRLQAELALSAQSAQHCRSYAMNAAGRVVTNYPGTPSRYSAETARLDLADFRLAH